METINMTTSTSLGPLMHQIAQEKITVDFNPKAAGDIWDSCNIPATYWNDLLEMKKIAVTYENGGDVVDRDQVDPKDLEYYPEPIDWTEWISFKIKKFQEDDELYLKGLKNCYDKFQARIIGDDIALTMNNILKHYEAEDCKWIYDRANECANEGYDIEEGFCSLVSELLSIVEKRHKFIHCAKWLCEQFGCLDARPELKRYEIEFREFDSIHDAFKRKDLDRLDGLLVNKSKLDMVAGSIGTNLQQYLDALKEQEDYKLKTVNIKDGWDAGFILPDGRVYAMNGPDASFIHVAIADYYFDENGLVEDSGYIGKDFQLMAQGWIKFNRQKILYDGYMSYRLGKCSCGAITQKQKDVLCDYIDSTSNNRIYLGIHGKPVTKEEFLDMTDEELEKVFS